MNVAADIPAFLDRRPFVGTFTILSSYGNCPHQMFRRYIAKDQPYVETPEMKFGNDVHTAFEHRVGSKKPLPETMHQWEAFASAFDGQVVAVEQKLGITREGRACGFFENPTASCSGVFFRGKADLAIINGTTAYINDWKTGSSKFEDPFELATNAMLLHARHPHLTKILGTYTWLKEGRVGQLYDLSDTAGTWKTVSAQMAEITAKREAALKGDVSGFVKQKSGLCGWCSVEDCEHFFVSERRK